MCLYRLSTFRSKLGASIIPKRRDLCSFVRAEPSIGIRTELVQNLTESGTIDRVGEIPSLPYLRVTFAKEEIETGAQNRKEGRKEGRGRRKKEVGTTNLRPVGLLSVCLRRSSSSIVLRRTSGNTVGIRYIRIRVCLCDDSWKIAWQTISRFGVFDKRVYHNEGRSPRRKLREGGLRGCAWSPAERLHAFLLVNRETGLRSR